MRLCLFCGSDIEHRRSQAKFCSKICRSFHHRGKTREIVQKECKISICDVEFVPNHGRQIYCNCCIKDGSVARESNLFQKYKITIKDFNESFALQDNVCAVCKSLEPNGGKWVVDHCHRSGNLRGILCDWCNRALGLMLDKPEVALSAAEYLSQDKQSFINSTRKELRR